MYLATYVLTYNMISLRPPKTKKTESSGLMEKIYILSNIIGEISLYVLWQFKFNDDLRK